MPGSYAPEWASDYRGFTLTAEPAEAGVSILPPVAFAVLWLLLGATGLVLLLTCANVANLVLARSAGRHREFAVRLAIGATRRHLIGQLVAENALIATAGVLCGLVLAGWLSRGLVTYLNSGSLPVGIAMDLTTDWRVFALTAGGAAIVCILCALGPALRAARQQPASSIQLGGRSSDGHDALRLRRALVVVQIALSIVLVVGAMLFIRTLRNLGDVELGFDSDVVVAHVDLRRAAIDPAERMQAFQRIAEQLEKVQGVESAAEAAIVPLSGADWNGHIAGAGEGREGEAHFNAVGTDYFRVMGTPLLRGRPFARDDRLSAPRVAIVNETFARRYFRNVDPIGQSFRSDTGRVYTIVGLAANTQLLDLGSSPLPLAYLAASQEMFPTPAAMRIVVRKGSAVGPGRAALTRAIVDAVPAAGVSFEDMSRQIETLLLPRRLVAWISGLSGLLAVLIASVGVYGIMSYLVTRRRVEIGVRLALGAQPGNVVRMIVAESFTLLVIGVGIGTVLAIVALQPAAGLLYGVRPLDPLSYATATGGLVIIALLAAWAPARRASGVASMTALRE